MLPRLLTEFIGTFFLVLTIGLTVLSDTPTLAPLAIGSVLMALVYAGGHVSGAHYNPAVTLAIWMRRKMLPSEVAPYIAAQVGGALLAAFLVESILDRPLEVGPAADTALYEFFLLELLFTFALVLVVLHVATEEPNQYFGLAIGFTVLAGAFAAGPISGGAFNPAVALGAILVEALTGDGDTVDGLWVYLVACLAGGALAAVVFRLQHPDRPRDERHGGPRAERGGDGDRR
ncbi:MAG TPA: aquaporin [Rubricoccaceae bacterium]|nr:aquaporin [Rubricoccaceae bacterium]